MKKLKALIALSILFFSLSIPAYAIASISISSPRAVLLDAKTGQVLYGKNADEKAFPASTTKIITAILALERGSLDDYVPISRKASYIDGSRIYLLEGEKVTLEQLLYGMMVESANDAAIAIAEHIGGSVEEFSVMMNDKAIQLGAKNTNFTNPNGLPDPKHVSTAYDLAIIAKHAMSIPKFREIVSTVRYVMPETNMQDTRYFYNGNRLIKNTRYQYDGANGIKTGYTLTAKHCFVGSAQRDGRELITVILNESSNNSLWENTIALLDYGFEGFEHIPLVQANQVIDRVKVKGSTRKVNLVAEQEFHYNAPIGQNPRIEKNIVLEREVYKTLHRGERLGRIEYSIGEEVIGIVQLVAGQTPEDAVMASGVLGGGNGNIGSTIAAWPVIAILSTVSAYTIIKRNRRIRKTSFFRKKGLFGRNKRGF